jgi:hypothetical protein
MGWSSGGWVGGDCVGGSRPAAHLRRRGEVAKVLYRQPQLVELDGAQAACWVSI